jgi:hypothetical protein
MSRSESIEDIIGAAVEQVVQRFVPALRNALAEAAARGPVKARPVAGATTSRRRRRTRGEMRHWTADKRARRVPTFVIDATGLDTKKEIVARFGENAAFEKGKPLPATKAAANPAVAKPTAKVVKASPPAGEAAARVVKAKPPVVRKAASK